VGSAALDGRLFGRQVVAVDPESDWRLDRLVCAVLQVPEGDDVAVPELEVLRRPDNQVDRIVVVRVLVDATVPGVARIDRGRV